VLLLLFLWLTTSDGPPGASAGKNQLRMCRCVCHRLPNGLRLSGARKRVRCSRGLGGLAINVFAIRDPNDEYEQLIVGD
jgi:hypothetical protein